MLAFRVVPEAEVAEQRSSHCLQRFSACVWCRRWDGLCQALSLHKCLFYFVHENQIWVRILPPACSAVRRVSYPWSFSMILALITRSDLRVHTSSCATGEDVAVLCSQWLHLPRQVRHVLLRTCAMYRITAASCSGLKQGA